jgi:cell division protein FtsQ
MHYQGTRVPLSEKNPGFKSAGIPFRSRWGGGRAVAVKERKERKLFSLSLLVPKDKPEVEPAGGVNSYSFYRPGVTPADVTPSFSKTENHWVTQAPSLKGAKWGGRAAALMFLVLGLYWGKQRVTVALQDAAGLKLAKVIVQGAHYLTEDQVMKAVALPLGQSMFKLDLEEAGQKVRKLEWVDRVFVERRLPSSILISVRERKPAALLDNGSLYGVDKEGRLLRPSAALLNEDLPLISGVRFPLEAVGTTQVAETVRPALEFFTFMEKKDPVTARDVSEVNLSEPDSLKVTFINGTQATFNRVVSDKELKRMARVLSDLNEKGKKAGTMDFRYRDMVLVKTR